MTIRSVGQVAALTLAVSVGACAHKQQVGEEATTAKGCPAPAASPSSWSWRTERFGDATIEIPSMFVERITGDTRTRLFQSGPRRIVLSLTSDNQVTRNVRHFVRRCELDVGDRAIEVIEARPGTDHELLALVPDVSGGPNLLVRVDTPYQEEVDALRRTVASVKVGEAGK